MNLHINISYCVFVPKMSKYIKIYKLYPNICVTMFIYTDFYMESHRNTQNISLYHKTYPQPKIIPPK